MNYSIQKTCLAFFLISALNFSHAATWFNMTPLNDDEMVVFFDLETLSKDKNGAVLWINFTKDALQPRSDGIYSNIIRERIVCERRTIQALSSVNYDKDGNSLGTYSQPGTPQDVIPGSVGETIMRIVCTKDFPKSTEEYQLVQVLHNDTKNFAKNYFNHLFYIEPYSK